MERDPRAVVSPVSKGRFRNVTVCDFKLRNFESKYSGDATEAFTQLILYFCDPTFLILYNKV